MNQRTIKKEAVVTGIGLHTGNPCTVRFIPAPAGTGVFFLRKDLGNKDKIPASIDYVIGVIRGTSLGLDGTRVHTVEHICSALLGLGIDNLAIELDSNEPPVGDGSAQPFLEALLKSGIEEQDRPKNVITPSETIVYSSSQTEIKIEPAQELSVQCRLDYDHPMIGKLEASFKITEDSYAREIAKARTFCFDYEVEGLKRKGLARGGSLDNAVVIGMDRLHNKEKMLRYPDEFVRHKILDFLGDLYLLGKTVRGKITAVRIGHGHNIAFVKDLARSVLDQKEPHSGANPVNPGLQTIKVIHG